MSATRLLKSGELKKRCSEAVRCKCLTCGEQYSSDDWQTNDGCQACGGDSFVGTCVLCSGSFSKLPTGATHRCKSVERFEKDGFVAFAKLPSREDSRSPGHHPTASHHPSKPTSEPAPHPVTDEDDGHDFFYRQAVEIVLKTGRPSISLLQRELRIGYNRSARLIETMENEGIVSPMQPDGFRVVLVGHEKGDPSEDTLGGGESSEDSIKPADKSFLQSWWFLGPASFLLGVGVYYSPLLVHRLIDNNRGQVNTIPTQSNVQAVGAAKQDGKALLDGLVKSIATSAMEGRYKDAIENLQKIISSQELLATLSPEQTSGLIRACVKSVVKDPDSRNRLVEGAVFEETDARSKLIISVNALIRSLPDSLSHDSSLQVDFAASREIYRALLWNWKRLDEIIKVANEALSYVPSSVSIELHEFLDSAHFDLSVVYFLKGNYAASLAESDKVLSSKNRGVFPASFLLSSLAAEKLSTEPAFRSSNANYFGSLSSEEKVSACQWLISMVSSYNLDTTIIATASEILNVATPKKTSTQSFGTLFGYYSAIDDFGIKTAVSDSGIRVSGLIQGGTAQNIGLLLNDNIVEIDGVAVKNSDGANKELSRLPIGYIAHIKLVRADAELTICFAR